jgi:exodeoxyribonuclease VII large subunit
MANNNILSVKDVNELIKDIITNTVNHNIIVQGEISNLKTTNGNSYFTLKDSESSINIVAWKKQLCNQYQNGDSVNVEGRITFFIKTGTYQITLWQITKLGLGELYKLYDESKFTFEKKGYFSKKRELPLNIKRIGIITSSEGAALQDILYVLKSNNFIGEVIVKNCSVQGNLCPKSVKSGIKYFINLNNSNNSNHIDVLIIARGGGSFEDLMGYSHKKIVKNIYKCPIITISAIGHEVDFMLSDLAADIRAPTPSIAGEIISHSHKLKKNKIEEYKNNINKIKIMIETHIIAHLNTLQMLNQNVENINPINLIKNKILILKSFKSNIFNILCNKIINYKTNIDKLEQEQQTYDYKKYIEKGYSLIISDDGNIINSKKLFNEHILQQKKLKIIFNDGEIDISCILKNI